MLYYSRRSKYAPILGDQQSWVVTDTCNEDLEYLIRQDQGKVRLRLPGRRSAASDAEVEDISRGYFIPLVTPSIVVCVVRIL